MKLRSLFLATLAAMAMVSCSNENDPIGEGGNKEAEKTALLDLGFAFPKATVTRANGDKETGTSAEYEFSDVAIIIDYAASGRVVEILSRDDFSPATAAANSQNVVIYTKQAIPVTPGAATINAIVNPDKTKAELLTATLSSLSLAPETYSMSVLQAANGPAAENNFMMTNETGISKTFNEGQTTTVEIPVNRVVAKLAENSATREFTKQQDDSDIETGLTTNDKIKSITLEKATYVNLAKSSDVFPATVDPATWWQEYDAAATTLPSAANASYDYFDLTGSNVEYCFENGTTHPTGIIYQAKVIWNDATAASTFYIAAGKLYMTYAALQADFRDCPAEDATPAVFAAAHIRKYVDGQCYYYQPIKTNGTATTIVRNNVYKMSVSGIVKIGSSTPIPDGKETLMNLSILVQPWTVNENAFVLK